MPHSDDPVFDFEQEHLKTVYAELVKAEAALKSKIEKVNSSAVADMSDMMEDIRPNFASLSDTLETLAVYEAANSIIKQYNDEQQLNTERLRDVALLLEKPYFAKLVLRFSESGESRTVYLGAVGFSDKERGRLVYDWRSPVAEVYYGRSHGKVSYEANGRTIEAHLDLRRQFSLDRDRLIAYFDTDMALQDDLLIESLSRNRSSRMKAITATIQGEQNIVVRAPDVSAMLVSGVAGSGKTSVMLQRLAYLLYRNRDELKLENVVLITPNALFQEYIGNVLPELGERNPVMRTWNSLANEITKGDPESRASSMPSEMLDRIEREFSKEEPNESYLMAERVKYVLIDEVQDYTAEQLEVIASYYYRAHFLLLGDPNQALFDGLASFDEIREIFTRHKGAVSKAHLATSYRSTAEITRLFAQFAEPTLGCCIESALRSGPRPKVSECTDEDECARMLTSEVEKAVFGENAGGTTAVIALQERELERIDSIVADLLTRKDGEAADGLKVLTLEAAKGLEFDHVILVDVSASCIDDTDLWRRRLYTAISRATKTFTALSRGPASSLLKKALG